MKGYQHLTFSEQRISILLWRGLSVERIALVIGTSQHVVEGHLRRLFAKLHVCSRAEVCQWVDSVGGEEWARELQELSHSKLDTKQKFRSAGA